VKKICLIKIKVYGKLNKMENGGKLMLNGIILSLLMMKNMSN